MSLMNVKTLKRGKQINLKYIATDQFNKNV